MKKKFSIFILIPFIVGCSTDLDIIYDHPTVPVVYSVIDLMDTIHHVRVHKTFIINTKSDWETLNSDSLEYNDVEVYLSGKKGDSIKWIRQFEKVDAVKRDGFFPNDSFHNFKLDGKLPVVLYNPSRYYHGNPDIDSLILEVVINDLGITTRASSKALNHGKIIPYKSPNYIYLYGVKPSIFGFPSTGESFGKEYSELYVQLEFNVHFKEYFETRHSVKEISWTSNSGEDGSSYLVTPGKLFNRMRPLLSKDEEVLSRRLDSIDVKITKTSKFFNDYWEVRQHWEDSDRPPYSNFDNSYGMFILITSDEITGFRLESQSLDSLCNSPKYREMKFKNW